MRKGAKDMMEFTKPPKNTEEFLYMGMCLVMTAPNKRLAKELNLMMFEVAMQKGVTKELWESVRQRAKTTIELELNYQKNTGKDHP